MLVNGSFHGVQCCDNCLQNNIGQQFVTFDGQGTSNILMLGESPWLDEVWHKRPFAGPAGKLLDAQLHRAGLDRSGVTVSNVMWCKPPYLDWVGKHPDSAMALRQCKPYWERLIELTKPSVIVTMGAVSMQQVLDCTGLDNRQAYIHDSRYGMPVVPTYHPSYILRGNQKLAQPLFFAIRRASEIAKAQGQWTRQRVTYLMDPPIEAAREYLFHSLFTANAAATGERSAAQPHVAINNTAAISNTDAVLKWTTKPVSSSQYPQIPLLVCDIETPNSSRLDEEDREDKDPSFTIVRLSFSVANATAISFPWHEPYISLAREALSAAAVVVFWNGDGFDIPRLIFNGCSWQGEVHDAMWAWHFLQSDLLKGLGFVAPFFTDLPAWKHLSDADPPYYSCCDADAEYRCYVAIRQALEQQGRWQRFVRHCIRASEILRQPNVGRIHVNRQLQSELKIRLEQEAADAIQRLQGLVPDSVRRHKIYKTDRTFNVTPDEEKGRWQVMQKPCSCQTKQADVPTDVEMPQL